MNSSPKNPSREPGRRGLRIRGVAMAVVIVLGVVVLWQLSQPDRDGQVTFALAAQNIGDGVSTDTPVRLRGLSVGSVVSIESKSADRQLITLSVDEPRMAELSTAMQTRFVSANVFGMTALELIPMPGGDPIAPRSTLDVGDRMGNFTVTKVLRESGRAVIDVVSSKLSVSVDSAAQLTSAMAPMLASALLVVRSIERTQTMPLGEMLPTMADVTEGFTAFTPSALGILNSLASVSQLDDETASRQASATITEVSNLVFSFAGEAVGALGPMSNAVDMMLDMLIPLNQGMKDVTPDQVRRLVAGTDGALQKRGDSVVLNTELLIDVPAFKIPLQMTGGGVR